MISNLYCRPRLTFDKLDHYVATSRDFPLSIHDDDYKFLEGHVRNGNRKLIVLTSILDGIGLITKLTWSAC